MIFDLFWRFVSIGLLAFGGGAAALPPVERVAVSEAGWVNPQDFAAAGWQTRSPRMARFPLEVLHDPCTTAEIKASEDPSAVHGIITLGSLIWGRE